MIEGKVPIKSGTIPMKVQELLRIILRPKASIDGAIIISEDHRIGIKEFIEASFESVAVTIKLCDDTIVQLKSVGCGDEVFLVVLDGKIGEETD